MVRVLRVVIEADTDDTKIDGLMKALEHLAYVVAVVPEPDGAEPSAQVKEAADFLKSLFPEFYGVEPAPVMTRDGDGYSPILVEDLVDLGEERGFSPDILRRAREHLGWASFKLKEVQWGPWYTHPSITKDDT